MLETRMMDQGGGYASRSAPGHALHSAGISVHQDAARSDEARIGAAYSPRRTNKSAEWSASSAGLGNARSTLSDAGKHPKSLGWSDWGSAPLSVIENAIPGDWAPVDSATHHSGSTATRHSVAWMPAGSSKSWSPGPDTPFAPPSARLARLCKARQQASEALVTAQRQHAAQIAENSAYVAELDDKIFQATTHTHASYKGAFLGEARLKIRLQADLSRVQY